MQRQRGSDLGQDGALGAGEVVLGEGGDLVEEVRAQLVVEEPRGEGLLLTGGFVEAGQGFGEDGVVEGVGDWGHRLGLGHRYAYGRTAGLDAGCGESVPGMLAGLLLRRKDMGCAFDAGGLHVALDWRFEGTDFEVAVDGPPTAVRFRKVFRNRGWKLGCFGVGRDDFRLVGKAKGVAIDPVKMIRSYRPQSNGRRPVAECKACMGMEAAGFHLGCLARHFAVVSPCKNRRCK